MRFFSATLLVLLFVATLRLTAQQQPTVSDAVRTGNILNRLQQQNGLSTGDMIVPARNGIEHEIEGDPYWDAHWSKGAIQLYEKDRWATGYTVRYNIQRNDFEFRIDNDILVIEGNRIRHVVFVDSVSGGTRFLVNAKEYLEESVPLTGFLEVLVDGTNALLKQLRLEILKPNFNPALNVGSKNTRILKKESYFFNDGKNLIRIKSKKNLEDLFGDRTSEINSFIKTENIRFNRESDLIKIFLRFSEAK